MIINIYIYILISICIEKPSICEPKRLKTGPEMLFLQGSFCTGHLQTPEPMSLSFLLRPAPAATPILAKETQ